VDPSMSTWETLNHLFTVVVDIDEFGQSQRMSSLVRARFGVSVEESFDFFDAFEFKRPARFRGGVSGALASPGRLFLGYSLEAQLGIRGQIIKSVDLEGGALFVGVPWMAWTHEHCGEDQLQFTDFPPHDSQMDQLLLLSSQQKMLSDLQQLNDDLEGAKQILEGQGELRQRFFNRVSHEVRTPLMGVSSALTLLRDRLDNLDALNLLTLADASVDRATEVINFALSNASGEAVDNESLTVATDIRHLVRKVKTLFEATALQKGLSLVTHVDDALATQYWCPDLIVREALINVVSNAVKFTAEGGVDIEVKLGAANEMSDWSNVIFEVSDSGPGIPESRRAQVFAPFETGVTLETEGTGGTGLGLSSTENNLKSIGGSISVSESSARGAMFRLSVPLRRCADGRSVEAPVELPRVYAFNQRLLLLDDSMTNLSLNDQLLSSLGFSVTCAASGREALQVAQSAELPFDLALLDINLPDMSGYDVARKLREIPACSHTALLALSAYSEEDERQKAAQAGMSIFITKPFKRKDIADLLADLLDCKDATDAQTIVKEVESSEVFDLTASNEMISLLGHDATTELVQTLEAEGRANLKSLQDALLRKDLEVAERECHTLASSCLSLGLQSGGLLLRQLELALHDKMLPDDDAVLRAAQSFEAGLSTLRQHLERSS
jgi:signal transduction histidine kinase/CheY-like chemotaxis protein